MRFSRLTMVSGALLLAAGSALGDDFLMSGASARAVGAAGVYLPGPDSALDAMAMNPAGLALIGAPRVDVSVAAMFARGQFVNSANSDGRLNSNGAVPYGAFGTQIGKSRFSFGLAALPEMMAAARWRYVDTPGGAGNVSYGLMNHNSEILAMRTSAGVGIYLGSRLQVGATLGAVYNRNTLQTAYIFQNHPALAGLKTQLDLHTSGVGFGATVGALVRASKNVQIGVAWKSRTTVESRGVATGNAGVQFAALGLGAARPDFRYDAQVNNTLPQSLMANVAWQVNPRLRLVGQADWINWKNAFRSLPVILTNGNNADINGLLGASGINDAIPLHWRDQVVGRIGVEKSWLENTTIRAGYARSSNPVPGSTLSPLTAAVTRNVVSAGLGYERGRNRFDFAYSIDPYSKAGAGQSLLKAGEYSNSSVRVGTQALVITWSTRL
jgi:long-subunit fatty acid transport protein